MPQEMFDLATIESTMGETLQSLLYKDKLLSTMSSFIPLMLELTEKIVCSEFRKR